VQRTKSGDYWEICGKNEFRTETVHYVPKLLAVSYILSTPRKFNIDYWPETVEWTAVKPGKQASLDVIASETGADRYLLYRLNQELLHGITPPDKNYELVVPSAHADLVAAVLERGDRLLRYYHYQIKYGDTLSALSGHYGVSVDIIEQHNPGIRSRYLRIGETIIIPALRETTPYVSGVMPRSPSGASPPGAVHGGFTGTHTVVGGDTLWSIATRFRVDPYVLARENNMEMDSILSIGKILKVPIIIE
jgi:membrane-bound lytic murein transglycosylase D